MTDPQRTAIEAAQGSWQPVADGKLDSANGQIWLRRGGREIKYVHVDVGLVYISLPERAAVCQRVAAQPQASLESVLAEVYEWQKVTFPQATHASKAAHLLAEAKELAANPTDAEEMADVLMLLSGLAMGQGVNLAEVVAAKLAKNRQREWGKANGEGYVEHVRDAPPTVTLHVTDEGRGKPSGVWDEEWTQPQEDDGDPLGAAYMLGRHDGRKGVQPQAAAMPDLPPLRDGCSHDWTNYAARCNKCGGWANTDHVPQAGAVEVEADWSQAPEWAMWAVVNGDMDTWLWYGKEPLLERDPKMGWWWSPVGKWSEGTVANLPIGIDWRVLKRHRPDAAEPTP